MKKERGYVMNQEKNNKKTAIHIAISTAIFIVAFLVFPLGAEKIISPLILPVVLFWSILLIVANFASGVTYGILKKYGKLRLICISVYNIILLTILIILFTMASIVFSTMFS